MRVVLVVAWKITFWGTLAFPALVHGGDGPRATPDGSRKQSYEPPIAAASDAAARAIRSFSIPSKLKVELFAAEPLLANPVAFSIDEKGVFYVAETFRLHAGVTDIRSHMDWLDADLACRTVSDRVAMYQKYLGKDFASFGLQHDRLRRIVDRDLDGRADAATVFADGFNDPASGIGAGVLARKDDVWFACIPRLWKLRDQNGDGRADERTVLNEGYGVHVGFLGHDLHGLRFGPDGRLYFSIGDRGLSVTKREGQTLAEVDSGSVLRCNPDGTELEVFATGLRNPQELAFDEYGNLFTGENNSDSGDKARWVYLALGGDSGWRIGYQFIEAPISRGPWNEEKLWYPRFDGQAAYIVPPIANVGDGPSGLTYDPGVTLLSDEFKKHFFLADFRGSSGQSGIRTFSVRPDGASFQLVNPRQFIWSVLATDVDFGPDGALYLSDWVEGWELTGKGRIYRVFDPGLRDLTKVTEVKRLLSEGMAARPNDALAGLLAHADMRIRQEAQFELAGRGPEGWKTLAGIAASAGGTLPRIHAVWGLGQAGRVVRDGRRTSPWLPLQPLLRDGDPEVRAQAAKVLGEAKEPKALEGLIGLLDDVSPRVRFFAAIALGQVGHARAVEPLLQMIRANADRDPFLRHAGVMGLVGSGKSSAWTRAAHDPSAAARMAVLLAMRRVNDAEIASFLADSDPRLVLEAARAINDAPIVGAMPTLARIALSVSAPLPLLRRILNANYRLGGPDHAANLAEAAARADLPEPARLLALAMLREWGDPSGRDQVVGLWRPIGKRPADPAADALRPRLATLLADATPAVKSAAVVATGTMGLKDAGPRLVALAADLNQPDNTRAEALKSLDLLADSGRILAAQRALLLPGAESRTEALRVLAKVDPVAAIAPLRDRLANGAIADQQGALAVLAAMPGAGPARELSSWLDRLKAGSVPPEIQLDLLEAAAHRPEAELRQKVEKYQAEKPKDDLLAPYSEVLSGGNAQRGRSIFTAKAEVECVRCHKVKGPAGDMVGGEVGPELTGVGTRQPRSYLLESIVLPDKQIAQGFESVVLATDDGKVYTGVFRGEDDKVVRLMTADGKAIDVAKDSIDERKRGPSAMPNDLVKKLSKTELRDLIEFLAGLKAAPKAP